MRVEQAPSGHVAIDSLEAVLKDVVIKESLTVDTYISKLKSGEADAVGVEKKLCLALSNALLAKALEETESRELSHTLRDIFDINVIEILGDAGVERVTQTIITNIRSQSEKPPSELEPVEVSESDLSRLNALPDISAEMTGTKLSVRVPAKLEDTKSIQEILSTLLGIKIEMPSMQIFKTELLHGKKIRYEGVGYDLAVEFYEKPKSIIEKRIELYLKNGWHLPAERVKFFVPREKIITKLDKKFNCGRDKVTSKSSSGVRTVVALHGLGGVGKTQLAIDYLCRQRAANAESAKQRFYAWFNAEDLTGEYKRFSEDLGLVQPNESLDSDEICHLIKDWFLDRPDYFIVYDNVEVLSTLKHYMPIGSGNILVTSRDAISWLEVDSKIELDVMMPDQAVALLSSAMGYKDPNSLKLAKELGYLPLALAQAGAYIRMNRTIEEFTVSDYIDDYKEIQAELLATNKLSDDDLERDESDRPKLHATVMTVWEKSLRALLKDENYGKLAQNILHYSCFLSSTPISDDFLQRCLNDKIDRRAKHRLREAKQLLMKYSLISVHQPSTISLHQLLQDVVRLSLNDIERPRIVSRLEQVFISSETEKARISTKEYLKVQYLSHHLRSFLKKSDSETNSREQINDLALSAQLSNSYVHTSQSKKAIPLLEKNLEKLLGRGVAEKLNSLFKDPNPVPYELQDEIERIIESHKQYHSQASYKEIFALLFENLGLAYLEEDSETSHQKAILYLDMAISIYKKIYSVNPSKLAMLMLSLSRAFSLMGDEENQWRFLESAFMIKSGLHGIHSSGNDRFAGACSWSKEENDVGVKPDHFFRQQAEELFEKAFDNPGDHYEVARVFHELHCYSEFAYESLFLLKSLAIYEKLYGELSPAVAEVKRDLGLFYIRDGNLEKAWQFLEDALKVYSVIYPDTHPKVTSIKSLLKVHFGRRPAHYKIKLSVNEKETAILGMLSQLKHVLDNHNKEQPCEYKTLFRLFTDLMSTMKCNSELKDFYKSHQAEIDRLIQIVIDYAFDDDYQKRKTAIMLLKEHIDIVRKPLLRVSLEKIKHIDFEIKKLAADIIIDIGEHAGKEKLIIPVIITRLQSDSYSEEENAREQLFKLGSRGKKMVIDKCCAMLEKESIDVNEKLSYADILVKLEATKRRKHLIIPIYRKSLRNKSAFVRSSAKRQLKHLKKKGRQALIKECDLIINDNAEKLKIKSEAAETLFELFATKDRENPIADIFRLKLRDESEWVRSAAREKLMQLAKIGRAALIDECESILGDSSVSSEIKSESVDTLFDFSATEGRESILIQLCCAELKDESYSVRATAESRLKKLGDLGRKLLVRECNQIVESIDTGAEVKRDAARILVEQSATHDCEDTIISFFKADLRNWSSYVRKTARINLEALGDRGKSALTEACELIIKDSHADSEVQCDSAKMLIELTSRDTEDLSIFILRKSLHHRWGRSLREDAREKLLALGDIGKVALFDEYRFIFNDESVDTTIKRDIVNFLLDFNETEGNEIPILSVYLMALALPLGKSISCENLTQFGFKFLFEAYESLSSSMPKKIKQINKALSRLSKFSGQEEIAILLYLKDPSSCLSKSRTKILQKCIDISKSNEIVLKRLMALLSDFRSNIRNDVRSALLEHDKLRSNVISELRNIAFANEDIWVKYDALAWLYKLNEERVFIISTLLSDIDRTDQWPDFSAVIRCCEEVTKFSYSQEDKSQLVTALISKLDKTEEILEKAWINQCIAEFLLEFAIDKNRAKQILQANSMISENKRLEKRVNRALEKYALSLESVDDPLIREQNNHYLDTDSSLFLQGDKGKESTALEVDTESKKTTNLSLERGIIPEETVLVDQGKNTCLYDELSDEEIVFDPIEEGTSSQQDRTVGNHPGNLTQEQMELNIALEKSRLEMSESTSSVSNILSASTLWSSGEEDQDVLDEGYQSSEESTDENEEGHLPVNTAKGI